MARQTLQIARAVEIANGMLRNSVVPPEERKAIIVLIETVLHETTNYRGFRYLTADEVPLGHKPGIARQSDGVSNVYPDESRRAYFHPKVRT